jgi:diketogulonate reductase-like aldo/keto reductase
MTVLLSTGTQMPLLGLGTYKITGGSVSVAVEAALESGYRLFDTARVYRNESEIGICLRKLLATHSLTRSDIFITSKLGPGDQGAGRCRQLCLDSIKSLGLDYIDLYLIHWPGVQGLKPNDPRQRQLRFESWNDLEQLYDEGLVKAIGVSNYTQRHLDELLSSCRIRPAVLQTEFHPHLFQPELLRFCSDNGIHLQAYSSLGTTTTNNRLLTEPVVVEVAKNCAKLPSQVLLSWAIQQNVGVIPKSVNRKHIQENFQALKFKLSQADVEKLNRLNKNIRYCWDPTNIL